MASRLDRYLDRWISSGLIDPATAERIRVYEASQERVHGLRWPVLLAIGLGGLLLGAGVLLFVAAHWASLSPSARFGLVLSLVAFFHLGASLAGERFPVLSTMFHAVGSICLGAGIFLAGQIFHLQEHWPGGVMLWALGAFAAWLMLRDWPHAGLVAILAPVWLAGEWIEATRGLTVSGKVLVQGLLLLSISCLTAVVEAKQTPARKVLMWIGGLALLPLAALVPLDFGGFPWLQPMPAGYLATGWIGALALPLLTAWWLRGRAAWANGIAALWVVALGMTRRHFAAYGGGLPNIWEELGPYLIWALGSVLLIVWGLKEARRERINLGVAGFALTVLSFYFSNVMDKLDRSISLISLGLLFVLGGWALERTRRQLVARIGRGAI